MGKFKTLVCFTASYPYGNKETYFDTELSYLVKEYCKIVIIPTYNPYGESRREVPKNVHVYPVVLKQGYKGFIDFIFNFRLHKYLFRDFFEKRIYLSSGKLKKWFIALRDYGTSLRYFLKCNFSPEDTILYSYWAGKEFFVEDRLSKYHKIIRMHGGDFYEERNSGYLPIRKALYNSAQMLLPISKDIRNKLTSIYGAEKSKIYLSYLGVTNSSSYASINQDRFFKIVSCSNIYGLKRVHLIYEILKNINSDIQIIWTHIGSGELVDEVAEIICKNKRDNIEVRLLGQKSQSEIRDIYQNNYFDFFINTSQFEGLPVSIMEAFSFGIPAIATNVGGTNEIVNEKNGMLIDNNFDIKDVAILVEKLFISQCDLRKLRIQAYNTWKEKFDADKNYKYLINLLND